MEVILREHVDNLGRRGEIVKVADGYARNYLLPRQLALLATEGNKKQIERERGKFEAKETEDRKVAEAEREVVEAGQQEKADSDHRDCRDRQIQRVVASNEPDQRDSDRVGDAKQIDRIADRARPVAEHERANLHRAGRTRRSGRV